MIRIILTLITVLTLNSVFAELINVNPDAKGEQWIAGGFKAPGNFDRSELNFIKNVHPKTKVLPSRADNSLHKYFRPVFNQVGGSCSQAAGVGYTFTYEINRLRDLDSGVMENQYPTHFTYNFLNEGSGEVGSWWGDGWDIIKSVGVMNIADYGGHFAAGGNSRWISGIDEWSSAHFNRVGSYNAIDVSTEEGLNTLKNWLHNHLEDSPYGGLAVFAAGATGYHITNLAEGTHEAGKKVITRWGPDVNHAMTYVGYDDSVRYDYNGDGRFTNDVDLNGDRIIDMRDWEIGAVIVANSWGESFGDSGFVYQMYKLLADGHENGGIYYSFTDVVYPVQVSEPQWSLEVKMKHEQRNKFRINAGVSADLYSDVPGFSASYPFMSYQGGAFYPQGGNTSEDKYIEYTLDVSDMVSNIDDSLPFKFFFMIDESDAAGSSDGEIISVELVERNTGKRYYDTSCAADMVNNGRTSVSLIVGQNIFVPEGLEAFGGDGIVRLSWSPLASKEISFSHYNIYRNGTLYASGIESCTFTDTGVCNGTVYTYQVAAVFSGDYNGEIRSVSVQSMPGTPSALPYYADFETGDQGWTISGEIRKGWIVGDKSQSSEFCDYSGNDTSFLLSNPDLAGDFSFIKDHAASPPLNISGYQNVVLEFDYILDNVSEEHFFCDVSVMYRQGPDSDWILLEQLADSDRWIRKSIELPREAVSSNYTQIGFLADNYEIWSMGGGGIDNVNITGDLITSAPAITSYDPAEPTFSISDLEPVTFSVDVYDEDTGGSELDFKWYVNGELKQDGGSVFTKNFGEIGDYTVKVTISDKYNEVSNEWTVTQTDIEKNLPMTTKLYQNYPNPFNPSTVIRFDNAFENFTSMRIFNSNGQLVRELMNRKLKPGSYSVNWDGRDNSGVTLSSGIYYCTLVSGDYTKTFKMMLFK